MNSPLRHDVRNEKIEKSRHVSFVFLLNGDAVVHPLPHNIYVALTRGEAQAPGLAGQTLRVADWYVRRVDDEPAEVVNETYGTIAFDAAGRCTVHAVGDARWLPTEQERDAMRGLLFDSTRGGK